MLYFLRTPITRCLLGFLLCSIGLRASLLGQGEQEPKQPEFDTGKSGLALSGGYFRAVPKGEQAGWTTSLWFQLSDTETGDLLGVVIDAESNDILRLHHEGNKIIFSGKFRNRSLNQQHPEGWTFSSEVTGESPWHHAVMTYSQANGPALYIDGKLVGQGERQWLGYATNFDNYHFGARVFPDETYGNYFGGLVDEFFLYESELTAEAVQELYEGQSPDTKLVAFNDFENVDHRALARFTESDRDEAYLDEGKKLYELNCIACHSKDGITPPINPLARAFTANPMENGGDPYSMFKTVTHGFRNMMAAPQLNPTQRYQVIHYIRERLVKQLAPEHYISVSDNYTDPMPSNPAGLDEALAKKEALAKVGYLRDFGNALISPVNGDTPGHSSRNALVINLGNETTIAYDLGSLRTVGAWQGGFLDFSNTLHQMLRAPGLPKANFDFIPGFEGSRWAWDGNAAKKAPTLLENTIHPAGQIHYRGHYAYGEQTIIAYSIQGRDVLESPIHEISNDTAIIHRRLSIDPGNNPLELIVHPGGEARPKISGSVGRVEINGRTLAATLQGDRKSASWKIGANNALVLKIHSSNQAIDINLALTSIDSRREAPPPVSLQATNLRSLTQGSPRRWKTTHTQKGRLASSRFQGYALDNLPVPLKNAYNTWMRTSSLTFFPDGRLAVGTMSGDVWIVSGIDDDLQNVNWQRFAAGLYEPMGMKVVDGVLTVSTRGRLVKLHDYNNDGEADFYEAFHNEQEPSNGWHAYSFDLEVGEDGSYYYARVGGFSDWSIPGGMVRISPDGKTEEVLSVGMRVPNGIGRLPDGRITFGDNQGTYVPASKISIGSERGTWHGAGKWTDREGDYDPETIVDPIVYMPQELDSSSGSQLWVEDDRFGPLSNQYFHTSFGRASTMYIMMDEFDDVIQGAVYSLPFKMESGTLRVAKNPIDGQLYYSGLTGWQAGATREGSIQRLRFSGEPGIYLTAAKARAGRLILEFDRPVDPASLKDISTWKSEMWNYKWSSNYGSPKYLVSQPDVEGTEPLLIGGTHLSQDGKQLILSVPDLLPCHTLRLDFTLQGKGAGHLEGPLYFTIHQLPEE